MGTRQQTITEKQFSYVHTKIQSCEQLASMDSVEAQNEPI